MKPCDIEVGCIYDIRHSRFGRAKVKVLWKDDEWIETEIVSGILKGMRDEWYPGDEKSLRIEHCHFYPTTP
jgi:hypothetical protein